MGLSENAGRNVYLIFNRSASLAAPRAVLPADIRACVLLKIKA